MPQNDGPDFQFMYFWVALIHSMSFFFIVYHTQDDGIVILDSITEKIDDIVSGHSLVIIHICDVNIHHKEWLVHSITTDKEWKYCYDFSSS